MLLHLPAIFAGLIIPALLLGRAALGAMVVFFLLSLLVLPETRKCFTNAAGIMRRHWFIWLIPVLASIPSLIGSVDITESAQTTLRSLIMLYAGILLYVYLSDITSSVEVFQKALITSCLIMTIIGIYSQFDPKPLAVLTGKYSPTFAKSRDLQVLLVKHATYAMGLVVPVLLLFNMAKFWRLTAMATAAAAVYLCHISNNISLVIGIGLGVVVYTIIRLVLAIPKPTWRAGILIVLAGATLATGWASYSILQANERRPERAVLAMPEPVVDYHRQMIWKYVWEISMRKPWTGWGVNALNKLPETDIREDVYNVSRIPGHPHNFLLEIFSETGILGTIPLIGFFLYWLGRQLRALCLADRKTLQPATLTIVAVILPPAFVAYSIWSPWWMLSICLVLGMACVIDHLGVRTRSLNS